VVHQAGGDVCVHQIEGDGCVPSIVVFRGCIWQLHAADSWQLKSCTSSVSEHFVVSAYHVLCIGFEAAAKLELWQLP
jgi:hypothetical protein